MEPTAVERKLVAILAADVAGYSRLMGEDEEATLRTLNAYRSAIEKLVATHRGRVFGGAGDSVVAEFVSPVEAVRCAVAIQQDLETRNAAFPEDRRMRFRIGVNLGDVIVENENLFGDGVNIAARLQGLAEAGGICIAANVHEQVQNKLDVGYTDLGEQTVKNVAKPVRVYRVQLKGSSSQPMGMRGRRLRKLLLAAGALLLLVGAVVVVTWPLAPGLVLDLAGLGGPPVNPPLPDKPSVAVLPFANVSGDPEQEYFSDGITEDLTTDLASSPFLFVISRNSAFTYKGQRVKVEDVGRELGVRYVLEGSVRKAEGRVRITAQLIDATTGFHVWSARYDRELSDIFALQSEISEKILATLEVEIREAEFERIRKKPTDDLNAYDLFLRGISHTNRGTREDNARARRLFERTLELDPEFASAYAMLGSTYSTEYGMGWNLDPTLIERAEEFVRRALELDPLDVSGHLTLAWLNLFRGQSEEAVTAAQKTVELAPNFEWAHAALGSALAQDGRFLAASESISRALRLNPRHPSMMWVTVAYVNFMAGRKQEAVEMLERVQAVNPDNILARLLLAAHHEATGHHQEARVLVQEILRENPDFTAELSVQWLRALGSAEAAQARENLRRAGLP